MKIAFYLSIIFVMEAFTSFSQNALNFDGIDDHVLTNVPGITGSSARTIEARIRTTANALPVSSGGTGQKVIVDWGSFVTGGRFTFNLLWANAIRLEVGGNGISGTIAVNDGNWHHVAVVYDPSATNTISLYVDGVLDVAGTPTVATNTGTVNSIRIGSRIDNVGRFDGDIDEVRVWNVARTQAELQADMNNQLCTLPSSLILYCPLNEGTVGGTNTGVTSAIDYSPSNGIGTLTGFALTGTGSNWVNGYAHGPGFIIGGSTTQSECLTYTWPTNGQTYTSSGFYQASVPSTTGCDSIIGLDLIINTNTTAIQTQTECSTYTWPLNGQTYTASGIHTTTIPNSAGCDSVVSLALTITGPVYGQDDITACQTYTWPVNGQTYTGTTSAVDTIPTSQGCDSIVSLNLTITGPTFSTQTVNSCGEYTWAVNGTTYPVSGTWDTTITNSQGCDSVITLNLTVEPFDISVVSPNPTTISSNQTGAQYQWIDCATNSPIAGETGQTFVASTAGNYAVIVTFNNCSDTSECIDLNTAHLFEKDIKLFTLSPNPNTGSFEISSVSNMNGVIRVLDTQGKIIHTEFLNETNTHKMDIKHLTDGLYFVQVQSENGSETLRLVKRN